MIIAAIVFHDYFNSIVSGELICVSGIVCL